MLASTPPSDDLHTRQLFDSVWANQKQAANFVQKYYPELDHSAVIESIRNGNLDKNSNVRDLTINGLVSGPHKSNAGQRSPASGVTEEKRMSNNGSERSSMTRSGGGSGDSLSWLGEGAVSQGQGARQSESLLAAGSGVGPVFRTPMTVSDPPTASRLYPSGIYTTASSLSPYSPAIYSGQSAHLAGLSSPYQALYQPYGSSSGAYSQGALLSGGHFPHVESYSAMLASMGSQVQHAAQHAQQQLPRSPYISSASHIPQYPLSASAGMLTPQESPGGPPAMHRQMMAPGPHHSLSDPHRLQRETQQKTSPKLSDIDTRRGPVRSPHRELGKPHVHTHTHSSSISSVKPPHSILKEPKHEVPSGKEGSLKHRILTRPSDIAIEGTIGDEPRHLPGASIGKRARHSLPSGAPMSAPPHSSTLPPPPPLQPTRYPVPHPHYPPHFMKGSIIELANGELKRVEDLRTEDFRDSADVSSELKIDSSTVVRVDECPERGTVLLSFSVGEHHIQVTVEATVEHPFFVFGQGWSSCYPERTLHRYGLNCHRLNVGDVCISLTHKDAKALVQQTQQQEEQAHKKQDEQAHKKQEEQAQKKTSEPAQISQQHLRQSLGQSSSKWPPSSSVKRETDTLQKSEELKPLTTQVSQPEGREVTLGTPRKRRWSAPDTVSVLDPSETPSTTSDTSTSVTIPATSAHQRATSSHQMASQSTTPEKT
ncbi:unnamed protein product [Owenia fusiformis]|uniref:Uncharacterized protein n=1 Tax=Owenia fusiformis TaxID=6347 RepID=A0A8J1Y8J4_OWEFU|nr:unnamed protein product [Owenia fusiformis]